MRLVLPSNRWRYWELTGDEEAGKLLDRTIEQHTVLIGKELL
jgi:hypothetical protein